LAPVINTVFIFCLIDDVKFRQLNKVAFAI